MQKSERGTLGRAFKSFLVTLVVVALLLAVLYLVSDLNRRRYRLSVESGNLIVERGRFLPTGFEMYVPETPALREAYAPIPLPPHDSFTPSGVLEDRTEIDRALFSLVLGWARSNIDSEDQPTADLAATYARRLELLPGLSEDQRGELRGMRAELAYRRGTGLLAGIATTLEKAEQALQQAIHLGSAHSTQASALLRDIDSHRQTCVFPLPTSQPRQTGEPKKPAESSGGP